MVLHLPVGKDSKVRPPNGLVGAVASILVS